ncbi:F-box domain, cyclin-like protein [Tanacetum coccineum]
MPYLNFDSRLFHKLPKFAKFVKQALSHRNNHTKVSAVDLKFTGLATQFFVKSIVNYAYLRNVRKMTIVWFTRKEDEALPEIVFGSQTLKYLTIAVNNPRPCYGGLFGTTFLKKSTWEFPALKTLKLSDMRLGPCKDNFNFFSNCVNLKDLTLHNVSMYYCDTLHVCSPKLCNLTITDIPAYAKVLNVVAPKLENLTASISTCGGWCSVDFLQLSTKGFSSLEKVNLSKSNENDREDRNFPRLLDLFKKLSSAKFLTLDMDIIQYTTHAMVLGVNFQLKR